MQLVGGGRACRKGVSECWYSLRLLGSPYHLRLALFQDHDPVVSIKHVSDNSEQRHSLRHPLVNTARHDFATVILRDPYSVWPRTCFQPSLLQLFASKMNKCHGCWTFESVSLKDKTPEKHLICGWNFWMIRRKGFDPEHYNNIAQ